MASITKEEFEKALAQAVSRQESNYQNCYALHFHWEDDNTNAHGDEECFRQFAHIIGISSPETYTIPRDEPMPGFEVLQKIMGLLRDAKRSQGRSVIVLHYAGHGNENVLGELELSSSSGKKIAAAPLMNPIITDSLLPFDQPIDFLVFLDCCCGFLASRAGTPGYRLVEILSAGDERDPVAFAAGVKNSLTSKLLIEMRSRAQKSHKRVEIADLMNFLRQSSPVKKPNYTPKVGVGSIIFSLNPAMAATTVNAPLSNPSPRPGMLATFSIHVNDTFSDDDLQNLVGWIERLPTTKTASLKLENVKETNSTLFIFESSMLCFLRLWGLTGVVLICENFPKDFSWLFRSRLLTKSSSSSRLRAGPLNDENTTPSRSKSISLE